LRDTSSGSHQNAQLTVQSVAPEVVWQVGRPSYQSEIWYGGADEIWAVDSQENH